MIIRLGYITACDFLEQTDYLFNGFTSTVGEARLDSDEKVIRYELVKKPTLREYIKSCKESSSPDIIKKLTKNQCNCFLYKCCYYIYPEKRLSEYKNNKGGVVESVDVFFEKCISLFFQLTGIDFEFLRISFDCQNDTFINEQRRCLKSLFDAVIKLFEFHDGKRLTKGYFIKFVKSEYIKFRYKLFNIDNEYFVENFNILSTDELSDYLICTRNEYIELRKLYNKLHCNANYIISLESGIKKKGYKDLIKDLKIIMMQIGKIIKAKKIKDVEKLVSKSLECEMCNTEYSEINKTEYQNNFFKPSKRDWKNECIRLLLKYPTLNFNTNNPPIYMRSIYYDLISSIMRKGNYKEAITEIQRLCEKTTQYLEHVEVRNIYIADELINFVHQIHEIYFFLIM